MRYVGHIRLWNYDLLFLLAMVYNETICMKKKVFRVNMYLEVVT